MWDWLEEAVSAVGDWFSSVSGAVGSVAGDVGSWASDTASGIAGTVASGANDIWGKLSSVESTGSFDPSAVTGGGTSIVGDWGNAASTAGNVNAGSYVPTISNIATGAADAAANTGTSAGITGAFGGTGLMGADPMQAAAKSMYTPSSLGVSTGEQLVQGAKDGWNKVTDWAGKNPEIAKLGVQWAAGQLGGGGGSGSKTKVGQLEQDSARQRAYEDTKNKDAEQVMAVGMQDPYVGMRSAATLGAKNAAANRAIDQKAGLSLSAKEALKRKGNVMTAGAQVGAINEGVDSAQKSNANTIAQASGLRASPEGNTSLAAAYGDQSAADTRFAENALDLALGGVRKKASDKQTNEVLQENKTQY